MVGHCFLILVWTSFLIGKQVDKPIHYFPYPFNPLITFSTSIYCPYPFLCICQYPNYNTRSYTGYLLWDPWSVLLHWEGGNCHLAAEQLDWQRDWWLSEDGGLSVTCLVRLVSCLIYVIQGFWHQDLSIYH